MPPLILDLGQQRRLAPKRRCARDPIPFGQHADNLGMGMLADLTDQRPAIALRHRVIGFNLLLGIDPLLKRLQKLQRFFCASISTDQPLTVHRDLLPRAWAQYVTKNEISTYFVTLVSPDIPSHQGTWLPHCFLLDTAFPPAR